MFRKKRGKIRKEENELLLQHIEKAKTYIKEKEPFLNHGIGFQHEFTYRMEMEKAKYLFLLKEARYRNVGVK